MEVSNGAVLKSLSCGYSRDIHIGKSIPRFRGLEFGAMGNLNLNSGFKDKGHMEYYMVCGEVKGKGKKGWNGVSSKKRTKLLKGLVTDLGEFSELCFGLDFNSHQGFVVPDEKGKLISQAAETLLAQLKQLRAEEEETKRMQKQGRQKSKTQDSESSSSSSESSESSDSECDAVVDMNRLRNKAVLQPVETKEKLLLTTDSSSPTPTPSSDPSPKVEQQCPNMILDSTLAEDATIEVLKLENPDLDQPKPRSSISSPMVEPPRGRRIEVCMGGKCKKSGAPALMEELQRVVGEEGAVVGCKCMGQCKSGPNVRVLKGENLVDDSLRTPSNPLYIGVGLDDVELIVASCFGQQKENLGLAVGALHS